MFSISKLFGKRLKEIRETKNIKQVELAELINIEPTNLSKIEKGLHLPKEENIQKIADALGVNGCDFFNFQHMQDKDKLIEDINNIILNASEKDIIFLHKVVKAYMESK